MSQTDRRVDRTAGSRFPKRLSIAETDEGVRLLRRLAELRGVSATAVVRQLIRDAAADAGLLPEAQPDEDGVRPICSPTTPDARPIWEEIAEIMSQVPEEDLAELPTDLAEQHDHYLYGSPKR